jgi:hypothetical protein
LADDTSGESADLEPFGDTPRVPVPNRVFYALSDLSGCAVRLAVVLMRESYGWTGAGWKCSASFKTRDDLAPVGMSAQSVRNAADELVERGWIDRTTRGQAHAYRWALSCPKKRFTYVPLALLHDAGRVSPAALTLLLAILHETWGQTERVDGRTVHVASAPLSNADLRKRTGFCASTVRSAADEVIHNGAASRSRSGPPAPFSWSVSVSFFRVRRTNNRGDTSREEKNIQQSRAGVSGDSASVSREFVAGEGGGEGGKERATQLSDVEKRNVDRLMSDPFGLPYPVAAKLANRYASERISATVGMYERQAEDVNNAGGWIRAGITEGWAVRTADKTPDVRTDDSDAPMADALQEMASDGAEQGSQKSKGGVAVNRQLLGMSHSEMCSAVGAIRGLTSEMFETIEHDGLDRVTFVPNLPTARWAWKHAGDLLPEANKHAKRMVQTRKEYEQTNG